MDVNLLDSQLVQTQIFQQLLGQIVLIFMQLFLISRGLLLVILLIKAVTYGHKRWWTQMAFLISSCSDFFHQSSPAPSSGLQASFSVYDQIPVKLKTFYSASARLMLRDKQHSASSRELNHHRRRDRGLDTDHCISFSRAETSSSTHNPGYISWSEVSLYQLNDHLILLYAFNWQIADSSHNLSCFNLQALPPPPRPPPFICSILFLL